MLSYKIVMIGNVGSGKSSILNTFVNNNINTHDNLSSHGSTVGVDFRSKILSINDTKIKLHIWDTAGQERFRSITRQYYRSANGIILVFDITTICEIMSWIRELENCDLINKPIIIVGNKYDLYDEYDCSCNFHNENIINNLLTDHDNISYFQASAKTGYNINEIFDSLAETFIKTYKPFTKSNAILYEPFVHNQQIQLQGCFC